MNDYQDAFIQLIKENKDLIEKKIEKNPNYIIELLQHSIKSGSKVLYKGFNEDKANVLKSVRDETNYYNSRLYKTWKKPIDCLETLIELVYAYAYSFTETFFDSALEENNLLFNSLHNIHARALLTSRECLTLLKNGYPDGAFSRWRTIYELSVVGKFLYEEDDSELCERYLEYYHIQSYIDETNSRERGHQSHTDDSYKILKSNYDTIIKKYGKNYANGDYGWASNKFNDKKVTFWDLKEKTQMDHLYGYYKLSSSYIHGNHKASEESLGLIPNMEKLKLVGPSNYGLSIPIQNVAISLVSISTYFFLTYSNLDVWTACSIMNKFLDDILINAEKVQLKIENDEKELRGIKSSVLTTSFKGKNNSSSLLLHKIRNNNMDKLYLTNSFITSRKELKKEIDGNNYKYIVALGQKSDTNKIVIELFANKDQEKLKTAFPYIKLTEYLKEQNIEYKLSESAGAYLCNNIYFEGLKYIKENNLKIKMIFIHIPSISDSYNFDKLAKILSDFIDLLK
ncbi:MAG: DUF5677 domain-containing protein [Bacilli bacterium]|nr:DUF5677 domain-containing protein [Bacilli bacterium]